MNQIKAITAAALLAALTAFFSAAAFAAGDGTPNSNYSSGNPFAKKFEQALTKEEILKLCRDENGAIMSQLFNKEEKAELCKKAAVDARTELGHKLPKGLVIPFVLILLSIAVIPLIKHKWWESHLNKAVVSAFCALPVLAYLVHSGHLGQEILSETLHEYYSFIVLLLALYVISGGVYIEGDLRATPAVNAVFLSIGAVIASLIGTTGAAMILVRPLLKTNSERKFKKHIFIFLIFIVANIGGSLTPIGDPPLFLGYLYGVPFSWTLKLWPMWLTANAILLAVFYVWDTYAYSKETKQAKNDDNRRISPLRIEGKTNLALLALVIASVILLRKHELGMPGHSYELDLSWAQQPAMLLLAVISLALDGHRKSSHSSKGNHHYKTAREKNSFNFGAIIEVAVLFAGIFIAMIPAVCLLKANGASMGIAKPWQFFWLTGILSSFLDNAPTYATYFALAQSVTAALPTGAETAVVHVIGQPIAENLLLAISLGAVFMGANTYIGNAPNFMIKAIAEEAKVEMPSFFGYMLYSICILIPVFLLITALYLV